MNPDAGFELHFPDHKVIVEGRNLKECYRYIKQNRLDSMVEAERTSTMTIVPNEAVTGSVRIANVAAKSGARTSEAAV